MRRAICSVCGRSVPVQQGGLRAHKTVDLVYHRTKLGSYASKASRDAKRAAPWCYGGAQQLKLL